MKPVASNLEQVKTLATAGSGGGCTIIPFRRRDSWEMSACGELDRYSEVADPADLGPLVESDQIPMFCVPWLEEVGPRQRHTSSRFPHWLRAVLLIAVSTVYAATAVAVCLSAG